MKIGKPRIVTMICMIACLFAFVSALYAQGPAAVSRLMPNEKALSEEIEKAEKKRKQVFADPSLNVKAGDSPVPRIDVTQPESSDPFRVAQSYEQEAGNRKTEALMIFASFSLPRPALKALIDQAHKTGSVVVLRGFKNDDLKTTIKAVSDLGSSLGSVQINPKAFTQYKISQVPSFVLIKAGAEENLDEEGCVFPEHYAKVTGDVTLSYAMEQIENRSRRFSSMASRYRRMLGG